MPKIKASFENQQGGSFAGLLETPDTPTRYCALLCMFQRHCRRLAHRPGNSATMNASDYSRSPTSVPCTELCSGEIIIKSELADATA